MEAKQQVKKKIAESIEIPDEILGIKISESEKEQLSWGGWSELKHNIHTPDGSVKDGKFKIIKNPKGEIEFNFNFKKEKLIIPEKLGNKKLTKEQIEELTHGKTVLINYESKELFLKVDTELNSVTISSGREIGIPDELGDYKLSEKDKENLANNNPLGTKLFKGKDGYFLANVRISKDRREIIFVDIKTIEKAADIEFYKDKFNNHAVTSQVDNVISVVEPGLSNKAESMVSKEASAVVNVNSSPGNVFSEENKSPVVQNGLKNPVRFAYPPLADIDIRAGFLESWEKRDFVKIREFSEGGFAPGKEYLENISNDSKVSIEDRIALFTVMGKQPNDKVQETNLSNRERPEGFYNNNPGLEISQSPELKTEPLNNVISNSTIEQNPYDALQAAYERIYGKNKTDFNNPQDDGIIKHYVDMPKNLEQAVLNGDLEKVKEILTESPELVNSQKHVFNEREGYQNEHGKFEEGHYNYVKSISLISLSAGLYPEVTQYLIENGADVSAYRPLVVDKFGVEQEGNLNKGWTPPLRDFSDLYKNDPLFEKMDKLFNDNTNEMNGHKEAGSSQTDLSNEFVKAVDDKTIDKLLELTSKGFFPNESVLNHLASSEKFTEQEKTQVFSSLVLPDESKKSNLKSEGKIGSMTEEPMKEKDASKDKDQQFKKPNETLKKAERMVTQMFDGL